jgi:MFS family permease
LYILVALLSNISNYYNYAVFGLAAKFLVSQFIAPSQGESGLAIFFASLSLAVVVRPFASIIFGRIGDKFGRSVAIQISSLGASIAMLMISFAPNFQVLGSYATIILFISRVLVITTVTAEGDGIRIYIAEHLDKAKINFASGMVTFMSQIGVLLASLSIFILLKYDLSLRFAFVLGAILNIWAIFLRKFLIEPKIFNASKVYHPIREFARENFMILVVAVLINGCIGGIYSFYIIFLNTYANHILEANSYLLAPISIAVYAIFAPISGYLADKYGFIRQVKIGIIVAILLCITCILQIIFLGKTFMIMLIMQAGIIPFYGVPLQIFLKKYLPINLTYTLFSLCHSLGSILISTPTLFIANHLWLISRIAWFNFCYVIVLLLLLIWCVYYITKKQL